MKDLTVIIPIHEFKESYVSHLKDALSSVVEAASAYGDNGQVNCQVVCPSEEVGSKWREVVEACKDDNITLSVSYPSEPIKTDFCSIVNWAVDNPMVVNTSHFSILEFDDQYASQWFCFAKEYLEYHQDVALMLPVSILTDGKELIGLCNEMALSGAFAASSEGELGYVNEKALYSNGGFNVTGGIFNTEDFKSVNKYKPSIEVAFNYELLCRIAHNKLKIYVAPRFGYYHLVGREDSLDNLSKKNYTEQEIRKWYDVARSESAFNKERSIKKDTVIRGSRDLK